jgi:enoyl-[acyl-carrier-protein] reductase (NADH)
MENMALELGPAGVTVACLRTTANVDSRSIQDTFSALASRMNLSKDEMIARMASLNFLKVPATVQDTANAAVLLASDLGRMMTGTVVNCTAGAAAD